MGGTTTGRTSALLALVACALVVCSALAVAPGGADAQEDFSGDITFNENAGQLEVRIPNSSAGSFSGQSENVTIEIGDTTVEGQSPDSIGANYTYTVGPATLSGPFNGTNGTETTVTVTHSENTNRNFSGTADIRYAAIGGGTPNNNDATVRVALNQHFGVAAGSQVPVTIDVSGESTDVDAEYRPGNSELVLSRATLRRAGVLRSPQEIKVSGREYVNGETSVSIAADGTVIAERLGSEGSGVRFSSPFFENGETYVVNVTSGEGQYIRMVDAGEQEIVVNSSALAAEETLTLTVEHDGTGNTIVSETVGFTTESVTGTVTGSVVTFDSELDVGAENATVWVQNNGNISRSEARLNGSTQNLTLAEPGVLPADQNQTGLLIQFDGEPSPLYATVTLQGGVGGQEGGNSGFNPGLLAALLDNTLLVIIGGSVLGVVVVAAGVYAGLAVFGSGGSGLNPFGGSSNSNSSNGSPAAETATVSFEVVDELAGRTYREADQVIARRNNGTQSGLGSGGAVGSGRNTGRNAGRNTGSRGGPGGVNTGSGERIGLSAGEGDTELSYGNWTFEVVEKNQTVARGSKEIRYSSGGLTHIPLSVKPYTVEVQVTDGPDRAPAKRAEVTVTADVERWQGRKRTDPDGRVQFEVPRSASRVTFTAETGTAQPVESDYRIDRAVQNGVTLAVGAETGGMAIETKVGERAWPGVNVQITPISEDAKAYTPEETATITMNSEGHRNAQNLPTGEYEVSAHPQIDGVETTAAVERVTVQNDVTKDVTLSIGVSYSIPETYRSRLMDLRGRVEELTAATNRDVAIPRYYGTVLASVLGLVETVESSPERVVGADISPDEMVEAVLDADEAGITAVEGAMSERRTSSLLEACASMPPAEVDWSDEATLDAFLSQEAEGSERGRRHLRDRLEETDDVLDEKWGEVNEIAPARKLHDRVGELARETGGIDDELTVVARAYVGVCLLDAIEELFEHDALKKRLNSGSY